MFRFTVHQTAVFDPADEYPVTFVQDEEIVREGGLYCEGCDKPVEATDEQWELIQQAFAQVV